MSFEYEWTIGEGLSSGIVPIENVQDKDELRAVYHIVQYIAPSSYLEIGASFGLTLSILGRECFGEVMCVDLCDNEFAKRKLELVASNMDECEIVIGNSHDPEVVRKVQDDGNFHVVLIDAGHTYDDVKQDYDNYGHLATKLLLFHDIQIPDVRRVWEETGGGLEISKPGSGKGYGVRFIA